ncbi:MAG: hypothetical protein WC397_02495 [Candidatus Paceibacterota bacterium]|jgi:hypothetical protein
MVVKTLQCSKSANLLRKQDKIDACIKTANKKKKYIVANSIASMGGASKAVVKQEILPNLERMVNDLASPGYKGQDFCDCQTISYAMGALERYGIRPTALADKAVSALMGKGSYWYAMDIAGRASKTMKQKLIKAVLESGLKENPGMLEKAMRLKRQKGLNLEDLSVIETALRKETTHAETAA